ARRCLEYHLAEGIGFAGEQEHIGARVRARELLAREPSQERGAVAEPLAQPPLLWTAAGHHEVQPWVAPPRGLEGVCEQVHPLLASRSAGIQDVDFARQQPR